jgi:hypothetical protein
MLEMKSADLSAEKQRGRPFKPGQSGNPSGRPKGSRNRASSIAEALLDTQAEELIKTAIQRALKGDVGCLRLLVDRLLPRRDRTIEFPLPDLREAADARAAMRAIISAVAAGVLSPSEAEQLSKLVELFNETVLSADFEKRLAVLERGEQWTGRK